MEKIGLQAVFETDDFKKGVKEYEGGLKQVTDNTARAKMESMSLGKQIAITGGAIVAGFAGAALAARQLWKATQDLIAPTVDYAKQIRDLMRITGDTAEETSKLIQVADDATVSYEALSTAMLGAVRKGIDPSVDSIARLSDEYLALAPGLERTKFLMDNFGRSGAQIGQLMEMGSQAILAAGQAAEDTGLVMSGPAVQAARDYEIAMDDLGDQVERLS